MGRDMLTRTIKGLSTSLIIGVVASLVSCVFAVIIARHVLYLEKN